MCSWREFLTSLIIPDPLWTQDKNLATIWSQMMKYWLSQTDHPFRCHSLSTFAKGFIRAFPIREWRDVQSYRYVAVAAMSLHKSWSLPDNIIAHGSPGRNAQNQSLACWAISSFCSVISLSDLMTATVRCNEDETVVGVLDYREILIFFCVIGKVTTGNTRSLTSCNHTSPIRRVNNRSGCYSSQLSSGLDQ